MNVSKKTETFLESVYGSIQLSTPPASEIGKDYIEIVKQLINDMTNSDKYASEIMKKQKLKIDITKIQTVQQIPKPYGFNSHYFPKYIKEMVEQSASYHIKYAFKINARNIVVNFITLDEDTSVKMLKYDGYIKMIIMWLYIAGLYATNECGRTLHIYLYMTDFEKRMPTNSHTEIGVSNINSGLSDVCRKSGEIVIYRKEGWFKVLIHETFHNYGLDFAEMNIDHLKKKLHGLFPINSKMLAYECYTELWAEIINCLFCGYVLSDDNKDSDKILLYFNFVIEYERIFSLFQMVKMLNFMGLSYNDLYESNVKSVEKRKHLYKQKTNVFPYFILKSILMNNFKMFMHWCKETNIGLLNFTLNEKTLDSFFELIKYNHKSKNLLNNIKIIEGYIKTLKHNKDNDLITTARMSICELV